MGKVEVRSESCKSCRYCVKSCPKQVLAAGDKVNSKGYQYIVPVHPEKCIGCTMCAQICPESAIEVWR